MKNINKEEILDFLRKNKPMLDQKFGVTKIGLVRLRQATPRQSTYHQKL